MISLKHLVKQLTPPIVITALTRKWWQSYTRRSLPDKELYQPLFSPWLGLPGFKERMDEIRPYTLVSPERCWVLYTLSQQSLSVPGDFFEVGVFRGGTAILFRRILQDSDALDKSLHLFDTFCGMPETDAEKDFHKANDFNDTSLEAVQSRVGDAPFVNYHQGFVPDTFKGMEGTQISFAHIDVDIHQSVIDCCTFIYPRLSAGGMMVFDDYGFPSCPGARMAVDTFFSDKPEKPLVLPTGQAVVFKVP